MRKRTAILAIALSVVPLAAPADDDAKALLQQALFAEEAEQKLDEAAAGYQKLISQFDAQRTYAVAAIYRLAEVRRKQQRNDEAAKLYQRILAEFPDAVPQARLSKENLSAMGIAANPADRTPPAPLDPEEEKELRRLTMLAENSPERAWHRSSLTTAASKDWLRVEEWLLDYAAANKLDTTEELERALISAAHAGNLDSCELLAARGADVKKASSELAGAIVDNRDHIAKWLVDNGADINAIGRAQLHTLLSTARREPRLAGSTRPSPQTFSTHLTPLAAAVVVDDKVWVDRLLKLGADADFEVGDGPARGPSLSALSAACGKNYAPLVRRLLALGADPNSTDSLFEKYAYLLRRPETSGRRWTPLHYGAGDSEIVAALLKAGANAQAADLLGVTPLHCACHHGDLESIRLLLEAGADANALGAIERQVLSSASAIKSRGELTPLMIASLYPDEETFVGMADLLVKHGADVHLKSPAGFDVFDYCSKPANRAHLVRKYLYQDQLAKKQVLTVAFPEAMTFAEIAKPEDSRGNPPTLVDLLLDWDNSFKIPLLASPSISKGFRWNLPVVYRTDAAGKTTATSVNLMRAGNLPDLHWGDLIEIVFCRQNQLRRSNKTILQLQAPRHL